MVTRKVFQDGGVESFDSLLRRFNQEFAKSDKMKEIRKREFAMSPSQARQYKRAEAERMRKREEGKRRRNRQRLERLGLVDKY